MEQMDKIRDWLNQEEITDDYLDEAISNHFKNKAGLIKRLGLNQENHYRQSFILPTMVENRPLAKRFLEDIEALTDGLYKFLDLAFMWQGKNKVRLGKIIPIAFDRYCIEIDNNRDRRYDFNAFRELLLNSINIRNGYSLANIEESKDYRRQHRDKIIHLLSCHYGDYIKNGRMGWYSANPYDYFTLSGYDCTYTSCVRIGGEYFNSVLHYLESDCMIPYFITEEKSMKKIGRCCSYLSNDVIATGRMFGSMFDCDTLVYRDKLQEMFGGRWIVRGHISSDYIHNNSSAYVDNGYGVVTIRKESDCPYVAIPRGLCLACGGENNGEDNGVCRDCHDEYHYNTCQSCGDRMTEDEQVYIEDIDEYWCNSCASDNACVCDRCDRWFTSDNILSVNEGDLHYCQSCADRRGGIVECDRCGDLYTSDMIVTIEDIHTSVCDSCADKYYVRCAKCDKYFEEHEHLDGDNYCEDCYNTIMEERENDEESIEVKDGTSDSVCNEQVG
jgi:hypothetical protein